MEPENVLQTNQCSGVSTFFFTFVAIWGTCVNIISVFAGLLCTIVLIFWAIVAIFHRIVAKIHSISGKCCICIAIFCGNVVKFVRLAIS